MIETPNSDDIEPNLIYEFILKDKKDVNMLDVGVGGAVALKYINNKSINYVGIDKNERLINILSKEKNVRYYTQDITHILEKKFEEKFDLCVASHIIEHLETNKVNIFIKNLIKTIKKKKKSEIWIITPNKDVINKYNKKPTNPYHTYEYTFSELKKLFEPYKEIEAEYFGLMNLNEQKFKDLKTKKVIFINLILRNKSIRYFISLIISKKIRSYLTDLIISKSKKEDYKIVKKNIDISENILIKFKLLNVK